MRYDYSKPLTKQQVDVQLLNVSLRPDIGEIAGGIFDAAERCNFNFKEVADFEPRRPDKEQVRLLIIVSDSVFNESLAEKALQNLDHYNCISLVFEYPSETVMYSYEKAVERFKSRSKDRINFLRPVRISNGRYVVPCAKIIDNSICDSVRIKYRAVCLDHAPLQLPKEIHSFFKHASELYRDFVLFHRSASDGYFAIRSPEDPRSFFVTATKTYKDRMDFSRISLVTYFDRSTTRLNYKGAYLPSSDSVEAAIVFQELPQVTTIVHTHASRRFTRNPDFIHKVTVPVAPYGEVRTGELIVDALKNETDGFIIMEDHGEVFAGHSPALVSPTLLKYLKNNPVTTLSNVP